MKISIRTLFLILLCTLTVVVFSVSVSFAWFLNHSNITGVLQTGNVDFTIIGNVHPLSSENSRVITGDYLLNPISIKNYNSEVDENRQAPIVFRFQILFSIDNGLSNLLTPDLYSIDDWYIDVNNKYYYKKILRVGQMCDVLNGFRVDNKLSNSVANLPVDLKVVFEAIQWQNEAYKTLWPNAPIMWVEYMNKNYKNV